MSCPICGDICRCSTPANSAASPRWLADDDISRSSVTAQRDSETSRAEASEPAPVAEAAASDNPVESASPDSPAWRDEVAARLNRYQAKRKPRPPRYPSLRLRFEEQDSAHDAIDAAELPTVSQSMGTLSNHSVAHHALALDSFADSAAPAAETPDLWQGTALLRASDSSPQQSMPVIPASAKIIEFPRFWTPPPAPLDQLAEPVMDHPRILEAPEVVPPLPALGGITIEPAHQPEPEKRPGIDIPLQSAPLSRRIFSAAIDAVIIASACVLFGFIFWKMTAIQPPRFEIIGLTSGLGGLLWAAYQYLLIVYSGSTPGLRLAKLELARFDGTPASRRLRRWRVLASFLSAVSLGMGYAWVFLDEDALCWHDRITHTYLAPIPRIDTSH
ncbi:MAG: RDD family protein [Candidatus Sulfotelmatobacter sp.]